MPQTIIDSTLQPFGSYKMKCMADEAKTNVVLCGINGVSNCTKVLTVH